MENRSLAGLIDRLLESDIPDISVEVLFEGGEYINRDELLRLRTMLREQWNACSVSGHSPDIREDGLPAWRVIESADQWAAVTLQIGCAVAARCNIRDY
jgi:hypothetical protein